MPDDTDKQKITWFIEKITPAVCLRFILFRLLHKHQRPQNIFYFDFNRSGLCMARRLCAIWGIVLEEMNFKLADIRANEKDPLWLEMFSKDMFDVQAMMMSLKEPSEALGFAGSNRYLRGYLKRYPVDIEWFNPGSFWRGMLLARVSAWRLKKNTGKGVLFVFRRAWPLAFREYAGSYGLDLFFTGSFGRKKILNDFFGPVRLRWLKNFFDLLRQGGISAILRQPKPVEGVKIAAEYYGMLNIGQPEKSSDIFFWQPSLIPASDIRLLFRMPVVTLDKDKLSQLKENGFTPVILKAAISQVKEPVVQVWPKLKDCGFKLPGLNAEAIWARSRIREYSQELAYWQDVFTSQKIKVYISWLRFNVGQYVLAEALRNTGGVYTLYQRAYIQYPTPAIAAMADIMFAFSREGAGMETAAGSVIPYYVDVGYIGDYRFKYLKEPARLLRERVIASGAKAVVAFFDENSSSDSRWALGHEHTRENYAFLLKKLLATPWLGLVLKPKAPATLRSRLGPVASLLEEAVKTNRCVIFDSGGYPPAAAALASDVAIHGHLSAATAGIEAALAGKPVLLFDPEKCYSSDFYRTLGKGKVVFDNWQELWHACEPYLCGKPTIDGFGDFSPVIGRLDSFRDGRAAERIGIYLGWLLEGFKSGLKRETVMADAAQRYAGLWGRDKITSVGA